MIRKLDHHIPDISRDIREVFQSSYAIEAKLLGATDFPPLKRPLEGFITSSNDFYGFFFSGTLAGVVEVVPGTASTHIQSLVVLPRFFRMGIGKALVQFVLGTYLASRYTVETGLQNLPATQLYLRCGFRESGQYDTDHGVRKVRFEMHRDPSA